jgi:hypothetical protein
MRFSYYAEGAHPERAARPAPGSSFFSIEQEFPAGLALVSPDAPELLYVGRFLQADRDRPLFGWQGSELLARFSGRRIGLRFEAREGGAVFFNVIIDGENRILEIGGEGPRSYVLAAELSPGEHELVLYKRSEAYMGSVRFLGLIVEEGAELGPKPEPLPLRLEFYGDSITAGACNDCPGEDSYDDLSEHDNYLSYGAICARALGAEYVSIAVSGTGLCESWNPVFAGAVWDAAACDPAGGPNPRWDFSGRAPEAVVINLGQNDFGFPNSQGRPFPAAWRDRYVEYVRRIRAVYPRAAIVCAMGGMSAYRDSPALQAAFDGAVSELESADRRVFDFRFEAFSYNHPRVELHRALAAELEAFLRGNVLR